MADPRFIICEPGTTKCLSMAKSGQKVCIAEKETGLRLSKCLFKPLPDGWFSWRFDKHPQPAIIVDNYNDLVIADSKKSGDSFCWKLTFINIGSAPADPAWMPIENIELKRENFQEKTHLVLLYNKSNGYLAHGQHCLFFQDFDPANLSRIDQRFFWEINLC